MKYIQKFKYLFTLTIALLLFQSCGVDNALMTDQEISYKINEVVDSDIKGELIFSELKDGRIQAEIQVENTTNGTVLPTSINMNSAALGGKKLLTLDPVDGATGSSVTIFERDDLGQRITYENLLKMDAHVQIAEEDESDQRIVAISDIGTNMLTGEEKSYNLREGIRGDYKGKVTIKKRLNGYAMVEIEIEDVDNDKDYSAAFYSNSVVEGGMLWIDLSQLDLDDKVSQKDVRQTVMGAVLDYENIIATSAHIRIFENNLLFAQADIGVNVLTGESISYDLISATAEDIDGKIIFFEREDGSVLSLIEIDETSENLEHPAFIRANSSLESGPILITLSPVDGSTGESFTSVRATDNLSPFTFQLIENYNGHVQILKEKESNSILAQGNIGLNAQN